MSLPKENVTLIFPEVITIDSDDEDHQNPTDLEPIPKEEKNSDSDSASEITTSDVIKPNHQTVITICSDDEDQLLDENSASKMGLPQIQQVFQVEEYILPSIYPFSSNHHYNQRSNETIQASESKDTVEDCLMEEGFLNSLANEIGVGQRSQIPASFNFQEISSEPPTKLNMSTEPKLQRFIKDLAEVVSDSFRGETPFSTKQMSNLEKTILEVSQADFDVSDYLLSHRSKVPKTNAKEKWKRFPHNIRKKKKKNSLEEDKSNQEHVDNEFRPPIIMKLSKSGSFYNSTLSHVKLISSVKSNGNSLNITRNEYENMNPTKVAQRSQDDSFSTALLSESQGLTGHHENNNNTCDFKKQYTQIENDGTTPQKANDDTVCSRKCNSYHQSKTEVMSEMKQQCSANTTTPTQKNYEYCCRLDMNKEKQTRKEVYKYPQNPVLLPKESNIRIDSSTAQLNPSSKSNQCQSDFLEYHSETIYPEIEISQTEFISSNNVIFDDHIKTLCTKMSEIIFVAIKEEDIYHQRFEELDKIRCGHLREKEKELMTDSFLSTHNRYERSFEPMFQEIATAILSNASAIKLQKMLLLSWFVKIFLKLSVLLPEEKNSPISIFRTIKGLLTSYKQPPPMVKEIFSLSELDFEKECWFALDFILQCFSKESDPGISSNTNVSLEGPKALDLPKTNLNDVPEIGLLSDSSRQGPTGSTKTCLGEVQSNYNRPATEDLLSKKHHSVSDTVKEQCNSILKGDHLPIEFSNIQKLQDVRNCSVAGGVGTCQQGVGANALINRTANDSCTVTSSATVKNLASFKKPTSISVRKIMSLRPLLKQDKYCNEIKHCRQDKVNGFSSLTNNTSNAQSQVNNNIINNNMNLPRGLNFCQPSHQNLLPHPNLPPTFKENDPDQFDCQGPQITDMNFNKTCKTQNQQIPHPQNINCYPKKILKINCDSPYQKIGANIGTISINQTSMDRQSLTSNTSADKVNQANDEPLNQTIRSVLHTNSQSKVFTSDCDSNELLKKQVASGALTVSTVQELHPLEKNVKMDQWFLK